MFSIPFHVWMSDKQINYIISSCTKNLKKLNILKNKICLICCRGGSRTIKDKNIKKFAGKPLLSWTLEAALKSKVFDKIILSTDSKKFLILEKNIIF